MEPNQKSVPALPAQVRRPRAREIFMDAGTNSFLWTWEQVAHLPAGGGDGSERILCAGCLAA